VKSRDVIFVQSTVAFKENSVVGWERQNSMYGEGEVDKGDDEGQGGVDDCAKIPSDESSLAAA
jgi:hypothetical protein